MLPETMDGRRLRFPLEVYADESVPGAIARATRAHVLVRTAPVFNAAGVTMKHAGYSQLAPHEELERLAYVVRCSAEDLTSRAGERVVLPNGSQPVDARHGRLILPRMYLELNRRRIAPVSLSKQRYHRLGWMNRLLPYAEDTFERMVSSCSKCGSALGWRYARGIEACDVCACEVLPSTEPELPPEQREDYRVFAQLSSMHSDTIDAACAQLPAALRSVAPGTLIRLALQIGGIVQDQPVIAASRRGVIGLPKPLLALIASSGAQLLKTWPHGICSWMAKKSEELHGAPAELNATRTLLKRLVDRNREAPDFVSIVAEALPELRMRPTHGFSGGRRYYLYNDVARLLGLVAPQIAKLRDWPNLEFHARTTSAVQHGQFDAEQIDELVPIFRDTRPFNACASQFKLPIYAIEQFCDSGLLAWENHPAVVAVRSWNSVGNESVAEFSERLLSASQGTQRPAGSVSLSKAVKRIGGRLKPWSSIMRALLDGDLPFWIVDGRSTSTGIQVRPAEIAAFDGIQIARPEAKFLGTGIMSQLDAAEVLNIKAALLPQWSDVLGLQFRPVARALVVGRTDVQAIARRIAWNTEIAYHLGANHRQVDKTLSAAKVARIATGWCRSQLIDQGILPAIP
jgi:hypothetical protein